MAFYIVLIHGRGIRFHVVDSDSVGIGFYAARRVHASSPEKAKEKAISCLHALWKTPEYLAGNRGSAPVLTVDNVTKVGILRYIRTAIGGHTFYAQE